MLEDELLEAYSNINKDENHPLVKIFVSYIKPSFLFKSDVLTPIHLGRSVAKDVSKDGVISDENLKWLYENCIGDNDFEGNISDVNRKVGFLTGTYLAYKNYEKLGNPDYFGSFGYRRLFNPYFIENLKEYDAIIPKPKNIDTIKKNFIENHGEKPFKTMLSVFEKVHPSEYEAFKKYLDNSTGYFDEIYILKKDLFFDFCNWIFPILFELLALNESDFELTLQETKKIVEKRKQDKSDFSSVSEFTEYNRRIIGFIAEHLTGYFLYKLTQDKSKKILLQDTIYVSNDELIKNQESEFINSIYNLMNSIKNLNKNYVVPHLKDLAQNVEMVSVVRNYDLYANYIKNNPFVSGRKNLKLTDFDNRVDNISISKRYNSFLNNYDYSKESWIIFCHEDWELITDLNEILSDLDKNSIYGTFGIKLLKNSGKIFRQPNGYIIEQTSDHEHIKATRYFYGDKSVDTLDCNMMMVHSSLINKHNLRFDENLSWDLYVEDFCINAKKFDIQSYALDICCIHHSDAGFKSLPMSYYKALSYVNSKYPDDVYGGTCSFIGGAKFEYMSQKELLFYKLRSNKNNNA